jgi:glycosyltransferase involved in cell wall biosynthesis
VVCSTAASLPEVVGDAAVLVAPFDTSAWLTVMLELWRDDRRRQTMREAGIARARTFSIERLALETLSVYHDMIAAQ